MTPRQMAEELRQMSRDCSRQAEATGLPAWRVAAREAGKAAVLMAEGRVEAARKHMRAGRVVLEVGV